MLPVTNGSGRTSSISNCPDIREIPFGCGLMAVKSILVINNLKAVLWCKGKTLILLNPTRLQWEQWMLICLYSSRTLTSPPKWYLRTNKSRIGLSGSENLQKHTWLDFPTIWGRPKFQANLSLFWDYRLASLPHSDSVPSQAWTVSIISWDRLA